MIVPTSSHLRGEALIAQLLGVSQTDRTMGTGFLAEVFRTQLQDEKLEMGHFSAGTKNQLLKNLLGSADRSTHEDLIASLLGDASWPLGLDWDTALLCFQWLHEKRADTATWWNSCLDKLTRHMMDTWHSDRLPRRCRIRFVNLVKSVAARTGGLHPLAIELLALNAQRHEDVIEAILELQPGEEGHLAKVGRISTAQMREAWKLQNIAVLHQALQDVTTPEFNRQLLVNWFVEGSLKTCLADRNHLQFFQNLMTSLVNKVPATLALSCAQIGFQEIENRSKVTPKLWPFMLPP
jgi:hypothetical protein